jgi:hypothetical protein
MNKLYYLLVTLFFLSACEKENLPEQNIDENFLSIQRDADAGIVEQQYNLGLIYFTGSGNEIKVDDKKAIEWLEKASLKENSNAEYTLAFIYSRGSLDAPADYTKASYWFLKAALNGLQEAQYRIGLAYSSGEGVDKDLEKAYAWLNLEKEDTGDTRGIDLINKIKSQLTDSQLKSANRIIKVLKGSIRQ